MFGIIKPRKNWAAVIQPIYHFLHIPKSKTCANLCTGELQRLKAEQKKSSAA